MVKRCKTELTRRNLVILGKSKLRVDVGNNLLRNEVEHDATSIPAAIDVSKRNVAKLGSPIGSNPEKMRKMERNPIKTRRNIRTTAVAQKKSGNNGLKKIQFKLNLGSGSQLKTRVELEETLDERVVGGFREKKNKRTGSKDVDE